MLLFVVTKSQLRTSKTKITTNTRASICLELHGSVAEHIKREASGMLTYL